MNAPQDTPFKDHFSGHAQAYASHRPDYPPALFAWLAESAPGRRLAWDVGTGNGQSARGLAKHFEAVHATDASARQIANATGPENVHFAVEPAESCTLPGGAADLACVAQALHWFDQGRFHEEVQRVLRPGGLFAAWTYQLSTVTPAVDGVVRELYDDLAGPYWPPERRHVEAGYADLPFPYRPLDAPPIVMRTHSTLQQYLQYLRTWSAVQRYHADRGEDPVTLLTPSLTRAWGEPDRTRPVDWPLVIRAGTTTRSS